MSIVLTKGGNVNLAKEAPGATKFTLGLGWDLSSVPTAKAADLDAHAFLVGANDKVLSDPGFVFFSNPSSPDGSVKHNGDNKTGAGEGDDEQILIDTTKLAADVTKVVATVAIFEAAERGQNFGQIRNAYIRVFDTVSGVEIARFDLSEDCSTATTALFGEIYKHNNEWKFRAVSQPFTGGLQELAKHFGVNV